MLASWIWLMHGMRKCNIHYMSQLFSNEFISSYEKKKFFLLEEKWFDACLHQWIHVLYLSRPSGGQMWSLLFFFLLFLAFGLDFCPFLLRLLKKLCDHSISQVVCGNQHCIALSRGVNDALFTTLNPKLRNLLVSDLDIRAVITPVQDQSHTPKETLLFRL